jgi:hypothetical protein
LIDPDKGSTTTTTTAVAISNTINTFLTNNNGQDIS